MLDERRQRRKKTFIFCVFRVLLIDKHIIHSFHSVFVRVCFCYRRFPMFSDRQRGKITEKYKFFPFFSFFFFPKIKQHARTPSLRCQCSCWMERTLLRSKRRRIRNIIELNTFCASLGFDDESEPNFSAKQWELNWSNNSIFSILWQRINDVLETKAEEINFHTKEL